MIPSAKPTKLPSKRVMLDLGKSQQTIADYAKVTPSNPVEAPSPVLQILRAQKGQ